MFSVLLLFVFVHYSEHSATMSGRRTLNYLVGFVNVNLLFANIRVWHENEWPCQSHFITPLQCDVIKTLFVSFGQAMR